MKSTTHSSPKEAAVFFLNLVIAGKIAEAYQTYVSSKMRHHNAYYPGDALSLQKGMEENHAKFPNKIFEIKHILGDGDFIAVHSHLRFNPNEPGLIVVHLFRFEKDKIVEFWDGAQPIPQDSPNQNGMF